MKEDPYCILISDLGLIKFVSFLKCFNKNKIIILYGRYVAFTFC